MFQLTIFDARGEDVNKYNNLSEILKVLDVKNLPNVWEDSAEALKHLTIVSCRDAVFEQRYQSQVGVENISLKMSLGKMVVFENYSPVFEISIPSMMEVTEKVVN